MTVSDPPLLEKALLPHGRPPWRPFGAGLLLQVIVLAAVLSLPLLFPDRVRDFRSYVATLVAPSPEVVRAWRPQPPPRKPALRRPAVETPPPVQPAVLRPVASAPSLKEVKVTTPAEAPNLSTEAPVALVSGLPPAPNLAKPRDPIQVGMFGDGLPGNTRAARAGNVTQSGSFESSGSGGKWRAFGAGQAVQQGLFGDGRAPGSTRKSQSTPETSSQARAVEILFKPVPQYTTEALAKKIEGDVLVEVQFSASGQVIVRKVVQGLGHGLDESAEAAARQIRFKPAQNSEGLPVDSTATVRMVFELAY